MTLTWPCLVVVVLAVVLVSGAEDRSIPLFDRPSPNFGQMNRSSVEARPIDTLFRDALALPDGPLWTRAQTQHWIDYYSPAGDNGEFFKPSIPREPRLEMVICPGLGRTATTSLAAYFSHCGMFALHNANPLAIMDVVMREDKARHPANLINATNLLLTRPFASTTAVLDNPVGVYVWDFMEGFPNHKVLVTLRDPLSWVASLQRLSHEFMLGDAANHVATYHTFGRVLFRQCVRRMYVVNSYVLATVPEKDMLVMDAPSGSSDVVMDKFNKGRTLKGSRCSGYMPHAHASSNGATDAVTRAQQEADRLWKTHTEAVVQPLSEESNPSHLDVARYMTPVVGFSPEFFLPGRNTSKQPIVIAAGFDGTGLKSLQVAFEKVVGKRGVAPLPTIVVNNDRTGGRFLRELEFDGLQGRGPPDDWQNYMMLLGHPIPQLTLDLLEYYENAKVILTVRKPRRWWHAIRKSPGRVGLAGDNWRSSILRTMTWGIRAMGLDQLTYRHALRQYFAHNAHVIHGVPKDRLLVWDLDENPSFDPLCDFLDLPKPKPGTRFPTLNPSIM